ncbi:MAG TPA: FAD-dependent oxidoreductase [Polyangiaceae bacterium]|nr:FAD-dependent oxidoreductase [Polyangiaceae bacterium]
MAPPLRSEHSRVVVLGAGLTGLSAGRHLADAGVEHQVLEKLPHAGGHAITLEDSGFRFDRTGHLLHLRDPEIKKLVLGWLGKDVVEVQRRSVIWSNGVYTRYPFQANTFGLPPDVAYDCVEGFVRAHFNANKPTPTNFEEFCLAHFGEGISRHFMIPYNARLWGVHPKEITSDWCQRFVPLPKLEDVLAGAVGKNDRELGYNTRFTYPRLGIGELPKAMLLEQPGVQFSRAPTRIDLAARKLVLADGELSFDVLVSTAPLSVLMGLIQDLPPAVAEKAAQLRCTHLYYLDVALGVPCGKDVHWVYVPEAKYPFYRVGCYSHFSEAMAPKGKAGLYVELTSRDAPDMDALLPQVAAGLIEMGFIQKPEDIEFARLRKIDHAYVIFDHNYFSATETVFEFLEQHRIVSSGRYGGWNYSSMEDALLFGRDAASRARELLP